MVQSAPPFTFRRDVDAELCAGALKAQIVRFDIAGPAEAELLDHRAYVIDMCLTPRPLVAKGCYREHWGPHRFERLGDIFLVPPGEALFVKGEAIRQASLVCELSKEAIEREMGSALPWAQQRLTSTLNIGSARVRALLLRIADEVQHPGLAWPRLIEHLSCELAIEIGRYCLEQSEQPVTGGLAGWRLRLIDERLSADLTPPALTELARICGLSVRQLTRGFRVSRGCSIGDYLEQRRMEDAKRMLMHGQAVKSVAFALGFASPSSFTFAFRRAVGSSPTRFRQKQARGIEVTANRPDIDRTA